LSIGVSHVTLYGLASSTLATVVRVGTEHPAADEQEGDGEDDLVVVSGYTVKFRQGTERAPKSDFFLERRMFHSPLQLETSKYSFQDYLGDNRLTHR
jgi:hypothetical protein